MLSSRELEEIEQDHLDGRHFGRPHPECFYCEEDGEPEAPDPGGEWDW